MIQNQILRRARLAAFQAQAAPSAGAGSALEISEVSAHPLREPVSGRRYTLLRLKTRSGLTGYGECSSVAPADLAQTRLLLAGAQAGAYEVIARRLHGTTLPAGAINMALLDLVGKAAKAPVYQILGGPTRFKARALAPLAGDTDAALSTALSSATAAGYRAFLVPVPQPPGRNQGQAWVLAVRKRLETLRSVGGENADFVLDGAGSLTPGDAASAAAALEKFHLLWFDEPCPPTSLGALKKISAENVTPVGVGRTLQTGAAFQDLLRESAIDVIRPCIRRNGISAIRRMATIAETYYVAVAPWNVGGPVATAAALNLAASLPNFYIQQIPLAEAPEDRRMREEIAGAGLATVRDGFAALPRGPGLGITVSEAALDKYRGGEA
jgi:galactonate dehydratase